MIKKKLSRLKNWQWKIKFDRKKRSKRGRNHKTKSIEKNKFQIKKYKSKERGPNLINYSR